MNSTCTCNYNEKIWYYIQINKTNNRKHKEKFIKRLKIKNNEVACRKKSVIWQLSRPSLSTHQLIRKKRLYEKIINSFKSPPETRMNNTYSTSKIRCGNLADKTNKQKLTINFLGFFSNFLDTEKKTGAFTTRTRDLRVQRQMIDLQAKGGAG